MSAKRELAELVESLPESASVEEAFLRVYQAFREKLHRQAAPVGAGVLAGQVQDGRLRVDEPCPLPDGTVVPLEIADGGDTLDVRERAALDALLLASFRSDDSIPSDRVFDAD